MTNGIELVMPMTTPPWIVESRLRMAGDRHDHCRGLPCLSELAYLAAKILRPNLH